MNKIKVEKMAHVLLNKYNLNNWSFKFDNSVRRFGNCNHTTKTISLSSKITSLNSFKCIYDTLLHEIAHALVGSGNGHNRIWKTKAISIGCSGLRLYNSNEVITPSHSWYATCPNCNRRIERHRKIKKLSCGLCCKKYNNNKYSKKYNFRWSRI